MRAYIWLAWSGIEAARFVGPRTWTPPWTTVSSARVSAQLPPLAAARSTTTDPLCIPSTPRSVMRSGAGRPGMSAVEITTSAFATCFASSSTWRACSSSASAFA